MDIAAITTVTIPAKTANSIQVMKVCQAMEQNGHTVSLTVPGERLAAWDEVALQYGLTEKFDMNAIKMVKAFRKYDFAWKAVLLAIREHKNLVYTWSPQAAVFAVTLGMPAVLEIHDMPTGLFGARLVKSFFTLSSRKRALIITQALSDKLAKKLGRRFHKNMVRIAPNGLDPSQFADLPDATQARKALGWPENLTVGCSGHLYAGRGTEIMQALAAAYPALQFAWMGGNEQEVAAWQTELDAKGIRNLKLTGFVPNTELPRYQAACDILLMPYGRKIAGSGGGNSAEICSPMKMFDYLGAGRTIMSSDLPVIHEVLNKKNAVFCEPENAEDWVKKLGELVKNPNLRASLARQARADSQNYIWQERQKDALAGF